jgi:fluoride exporter
MSLLSILMLMMGGIAGTLLRYIIIQMPLILCQLKMNVILVNILGSFIAGIFFAISKRYDLDVHYTLLIIIGFCGAFTTMSSCVLDTILICQKDGFLLALSNLSLNVLLSLAAVWIGLKLFA